MNKPDPTKLGWFDRSIDGCLVTSIPAGDVPKFIKVKLPGPDEAVIDAWWTGIPDLEEDQSVSLRRSDGNQAQYTISGGGSGTAPPSAHPHLAEEITTDTTDFDGNLSALDNTVQKALETLDEITATAWPFDNVVHAKTDAELTAAVAAAVAGQTTIIIDCDIQLADDIEIDKAISIVGFSGGYSVPTIKGKLSGGRCFTVSGTNADFISFSNLTIETIETDILFVTNRSVFLENCTFRFVGPVTGDVGGVVSFVTSARVEDIQVKVFNCRFLNVDPGDSFGFGLWLINTDTTYGPDALTAEVHHSAFAVVSSDIEAEEATIRLYDPVLPNGINEIDSVITGSWMDGTGKRFPNPSDLAAADGSPDPAWSVDNAGNLSNPGNGGDVYIAGDEAGVKQRVVNIYQASLTDHFDTNTLDAAWSWAAYTGFVTPGSVNLSSFPSALYVNLTGAQSATSRAFAYRSTYGGTILCRCHPALDCRVGLRLDDGTNSNYVESFLEYGSGLMKLRYRYSVAGVVTGPTDIWATPQPVQWVALKILEFSTTNKTLYYAIDGSDLTNVVLVSPAAITYSRSGIYYEQIAGAVNAARGAAWDWYKQ